jgi:hypothetical protein
MSNDVTIIHKETQAVQLGVLESTGTRYHHIRLIDGALLGQTEPSVNITRLPIWSVTLIFSFRYDLLTAYVERNKEALLWQSQRQDAITMIKAEAAAKMERGIETAIKRWEKDNPQRTLQGDSMPEGQIGHVVLEPSDEVAIVDEDDSVDDEADESQTWPGNRAWLVPEAVAPTVEPFMVDGVSWEIGTLVFVKDTFDQGLIAKIERVDGMDNEFNVWVAIGGGPGEPGEHPVMFSSDKLIGPESPTDGEL